MKTALDHNGSLSLPEDLRARLGLNPGDEVELEEQGDRLIVRPARLPRAGNGEGRVGTPASAGVRAEPRGAQREPTSAFTLPFGEDAELVFSCHPGNPLSPVLERFSELGRLPPNWNSYGAQAIDPETAAAAMTLLLDVLSPTDPLPAIVPTSRGGILLEWHAAGVDLEVDVRSPTWVHVCIEDAGKEEDRDNADIAFIAEGLDKLRSRLEQGH